VRPAAARRPDGAAPTAWPGQEREEADAAYAYSAALARRFGPQGTPVATKLSAFLLLCIGAQIMLTGCTDALRPIFAPGEIVP